MEKERDVSTAGEEQESGKLRVSRRGFLKGMGVSTAAAAMATAMVPGLEAETAPLVKGIREAMIVTEINGKKYRLAVKSHWTLLDVLRREIGLTGTKKTCDRSSCGACTVIMDGKAIYACSHLAFEADKRKITTIEALSRGRNAASDSSGLRTGGRVSVWFLHAGPDHVDEGVARLQPAGEPGRDKRSPFGKHLPMLRLPQDHQSGVVAGAEGIRGGRYYELGI